MAKVDSPRPRASPRYESPGRRVNDSRPVEDLEKAFKACQVVDTERRKLDALQRRTHSENADLHESALAKEHDVALEQVASHRDRLRKDAETTLQRFYRQQAEERRLIEEERKRREEEERLRQIRQAQEKAERDRKLAEEQERLRKAEEDRVRAEEERVRARQEQVRAEEARKAREKEEARLAEETAKQKQDEARKADEERQKAEDARLAAESRTQAQSAVAPDVVHQEYVELYRNLKTWSNTYWDELTKQSKAQKNPKIKEEIGETRRMIRGEIGKLSTIDKDINKMVSEKLKTALRNLLQQTTPVVGKRLPINSFLPASLKLDDNNQTTITDMAAYFLIWLTKQVVKIFTSYVHSGPERAEPLGVLLSSIFALPEIQYERPNPPNPQSARQNLFPIFLAKYHHICPALFGVTTPPGHNQSTAAGKSALGWQLAPANNEGEPKRTFVTEQTHYDRMKGLAIGYSSIALRNFAAVSMPNPYPPKHFWKSLASIVNLPIDKVTPTHVCVLRYMFGHGGVGRFLLFFGSVGVAVLREAFVEFPKRLPPELQKDHYVKDLVFWVENVLPDKEHLHLA